MAHPPVLKPPCSSLRAQPQGGEQTQGSERFSLCTQPEPRGISSADFDIFIWEPFKLSARLYDSKLLLFCKSASTNCKSLPVCGRSGDADREGGSGAPSPWLVLPPEGNISRFSSKKKPRARRFSSKKKPRACQGKAQLPALRWRQGCSPSRGPVPSPPPAPRPALQLGPRVLQQPRSGKGPAASAANVGRLVGLVQGCVPRGAGQRCLARLLTAVLKGEKSNEDTQENF